MLRPYRSLGIPAIRMIFHSFLSSQTSSYCTFLVAQTDCAAPILATSDMWPLWFVRILLLVVPSVSCAYPRNIRACPMTDSFQWEINQLNKEEGTLLAAWWGTKQRPLGGIFKTYTKSLSLKILWKVVFNALLRICKWNHDISADQESKKEQELHLSKWE